MFEPAYDELDRHLNTRHECMASTCAHCEHKCAEICLLPNQEVAFTALRSNYSCDESCALKNGLLLSDPKEIRLVLKYRDKIEMPREKAQRSILHAFTFEKLCNGHALWMFYIQT